MNMKTCRRLLAIGRETEELSAELDDVLIAATHVRNPAHAAELQARARRIEKQLIQLDDRARSLGATVRMVACDA